MYTYEGRINRLNNISMCIKMYVERLVRSHTTGTNDDDDVPNLLQTAGNRIKRGLRTRPGKKRMVQFFQKSI